MTDSFRDQLSFRSTAQSLNGTDQNRALQEQIITLEAQLQREQEEHKATKKKLQASGDSLNKEKQLRMQFQSGLQREQEDKKEAQKKEREAFAQLKEKEEERR
ncbi:MAG: hypothetical protein EZS28_053664, partial [Streblomastix strix]